MTPHDPASQIRHNRLRTLLQKWTSNDLAIQAKYNDIGAQGKPEGLKPSMIGKLAKWVEQIAGLREKEKDIISEITAIEEKHKAMRESKKLRAAAPAPRPDHDAMEEPEPEPKSRLWLWLLALWMMDKAGPSKENKPQNG